MVFCLHENFYFCSQPNSDSEDKKHGIQTVTSTDSVQEYFKKKMAERMNKLTGSGDKVKGAESDGKSDSSDTERVGFEFGNSRANQYGMMNFAEVEVAENVESSQKKKKKKSKKRKVEKVDLDTFDDSKEVDEVKNVMESKKKDSENNIKREILIENIEEKGINKKTKKSKKRKADQEIAEANDDEIISGHGADTGKDKNKQKKRKKINIAQEDMSNNHEKTDIEADTCDKSVLVVEEDSTEFFEGKVSSKKLKKRKQRQNSQPEENCTFTLGDEGDGNTLHETEVMLMGIFFF